MTMHKALYLIDDINRLYVKKEGGKRLTNVEMQRFSVEKNIQEKRKTNYSSNSNIKNRNNSRNFLKNSNKKVSKTKM